MDAEGAMTQISHVTDAPSGLEWSPDGKSIAFLMNVPVRDTWRIPMPTPPKGAKWTEAPKVTYATQLSLRSRRLHDESYRHVFVIPARRRHAAPDLEWRLESHRRAFSGDSKWVAFSSLREPNAESAFRKSSIYAANVRDRRDQAADAPQRHDGSPSYSPDGKLIAFMSADFTDHSAWAETKLWMMNADGSAAHVVSGNLDRPISGVVWSEDNSGVYFNVESEGSKNLYFASTAGSSIR
jgi:Tol biopolymer transport system component